MPNKLHKSKSGFTIIEVVLVLAIAGLIFLMVFLALPALQRSQRDTQRRNDMARFASQVVQYQTNNRGKVPNTQLNSPEPGGVSITTSPNADETKEGLPGDIKNGIVENTAWTTFLNTYMWAANDDFTDPGGTAYAIQDHGLIGKLKGLPTVISQKSNATDMFNIAFSSEAFAADDDQSEGDTPKDSGESSEDTVSFANRITEVDSTIHVIHGAICGSTEGVVEKSANASVRKLAFVYKLEGAGFYCGEV